MSGSSESSSDDEANLDHITYDETTLHTLESSVQSADNPSTSETSSCCYYLNNANMNVDEAVASYITTFLHVPDQCLSTAIINSCQTILHVKEGELLSEVGYFAVIDQFMRCRHDLLHNLAMSAVGLAELKTDQKFSDVFPEIDSKKTPDRIVVKEKLVIIIETTATLNVFRSYMGKGKIEEGFKSKYEREIIILQGLGYNVEYCVLAFDVKDATNLAYKRDLSLLSKLLNSEVSDDKSNLLELSRCMFCNYSQKITKLYSSEITSLFTDFVQIGKPKLENIDCFFEDAAPSNVSYHRVTVSTSVYNRVCNSWPRLLPILERTCETSDKSLVPYFDHSKNKFGFLKQAGGVCYEEMFNTILDDQKPQFCKQLVQLIDGVLYTGDRPEIEFFAKTVETGPIQKNCDSFSYIRHLNSSEWQGRTEIGDIYEKNLKLQTYSRLRHISDNENYEDIYIDEIGKFFSSVKSEEDLDAFFNKLNKKPFASSETTNQMVKEAVDNYDKQLSLLNDQSDDGKCFLYQKPPFLLPLVKMELDPSEGFKNVPFVALEVANKCNFGDYTNTAIDLTKRADFEWGTKKLELDHYTQELREEIKVLNKKIYVEQLKWMRSLGETKIPKLKDLPGLEDEKQKISELNRKLVRANPNGASKLSMVKLPCKKGKFKLAFAAEMSHFKKKRDTSVYKGVGLLDHEQLFNQFLALKAELMSPSVLTNADEIYHDFVSDDVGLLKQLKTDYLGEYSSNYKQLKGTSIYQSAMFVSRFCHTLAYLSQTSIGSEYVMIDNLGYGNILLLVRGGKKSFKTKKSKMYRILYPIHDCIASWYSSPGMDSSCQLVKHETGTYLMTPWSVLDEVIMNDGVSFLHRVMTYVLLSHEQDLWKALNKCFFNIILAFHARRKTEELLHNVRYVCVNSISCCSRLDLMLPELAGFNYDSFQSFIRTSIRKNFYNFSVKLLGFNNEKKASAKYFKEVGLTSIFDEYNIDSLEDLTMTIYSTFLMSKAPTNQQLEQAKNLKSMLKTDLKHKEESSRTPIGQYEANSKELVDLTDYWNGLFESDFNYDSRYMVTLGKFASSYMKNIIDKSEVNTKWVNICNSNWDDFANTKGLRSGDAGKFFNKKGYYIVYREILKDPNLVETVKTTLTSLEDDFKKKKKLNDLNLTYVTKMGCKDVDYLIFHVVDKKQRGGSREIYVMDLNTKINQQIIEKLFGFLCKKVPNEAISIPSNRRLQHIHTNVFERFQVGENESYNLTLDCRKWAPHSVLNKYVDFVIGMSDFLPESMVTHFLIFFSKMYEKRVYTRDKVYDILKNNTGLDKNLLAVMVKDEERSGYYFEMNYSWVMGIFNYLSSFVHVMNQLHISHMILTATIREKAEPIFYHMNAHSDDSGGKVQVKNFLEMKKSFFIYELALKSANHMLSDKKCNISKRYFEFLSVLYINNSLLTLLTKISGSFVFSPSDTGYSGDVNDGYSKCIELISSGATFSQAYLSMKVSSHLNFKFYFHREPAATDYDCPPQLLGMPDAHPIMVLISGSDSDVIRLTQQNCGKFLEFVFISNCFRTGGDLRMDVIKPIKQTPNVRLDEDLLEQKSLINVEGLCDNLQWLVKNFNSKNTALNLLRYGASLQDKSFVAALVDETMTRRISRAYYFRVANNIQTPWGKINIKTAKLCITFIMSKGLISKLDKEVEIACSGILNDLEVFVDGSQELYNMYELMNSEVYSFIKNLSRVTYRKDDICTELKTCKPMHFNMQKTALPTTSDFDPASLSIWMKFPEYRWLLGFSDDYKGKAENFVSFLERHNLNYEKVDIDWLFTMLHKLKSKYVKEYFIYSNVPADMRDVSTYRDFLLFLSHNSFKGKVIKGITLPIGNRVVNPLQIVMGHKFDKDIMDVWAFINYCFSIISNPEFIRDMAKYKMVGEPLGVSGDNVYSILTNLIKLWEIKPSEQNMVVPHLRTLLKHMDGELNSAPWLSDSNYYCFVKSQKLIGNVWLGRGLLYVNTPDCKFELELLSNRVDKITGTKKEILLCSATIAYLNSVLLNANLPKIGDHFKRPDLSKWDSQTIGLTSAGFYCIGKTKDFTVCFDNFHFMPNLNLPVARPDMLQVKIKMDFSYEFTHTDELRGDRTYKVNVLKVTPTETLELLEKIYGHEDNYKTAESDQSNFATILKAFVGDITNVELHVDKSQVVRLFSLTRIYEVISKLYKSGRLTQHAFQNRKHTHPGQYGGLLCALIEYKELDPNFRFTPEALLTPEYMQLKSSQPESFMTNLITNIEEKYNMLYSGDDKVAIKDDLIKFSNIMNEPDSFRKIMPILTKWGYIGVHGALEGIKLVKKAKNYESFRFYTENTFCNDYQKTVVKNLMASIVLSVKKLNYFLDVDIGSTFLLCKDLEDVKKLLISLTHTSSICSYGLKGNGLSRAPVEYIKLANTLTKLFRVEGFSEVLAHEMDKDPLLAILPVGLKHVNDLVVLIETCLLTNTNHIATKRNLDIVKLREHDHDLIQPYVHTKEILSGTPIDFNLRFAYHHGVIDRDTLRQLNMHKVLVLKNGGVFDLNCTIKQERSKKFPLNKKYHSRGTFNSDIDSEDDDFDEFISELREAEPDEDVLEEGDEKFVRKPKKLKSKIRLKGKIVEASHVNINVILGFNLKANPEDMNKIRNLGENILLVTNIYIEELIENESAYIQIFHKPHHVWGNRSLLDPECVLYYLLTGNHLPQELICLAFDLVPIEKAVLIEMQKKTPCNTVIGEKGERKFVSNYMSIEQKLNFLKIADMEEQSESELKSWADEAEYKESLDSLQSQLTLELKGKGYPADFIDKIDKMEKGTEEEKSDRAIKKLLLGFMEGKDVAKVLKATMKSNISKLLGELNDVSLATKIFEVAGIFSNKPAPKNTFKNRSIKEPRLEAELECVAPGLLTQILCGKLAISAGCKRRFQKQIRMLNRWIESEKGANEMKHFYLRLAGLILNDAYNDEQENHDEGFDKLKEFLVDIIVDDNDEDSSQLGSGNLDKAFGMEAGGGSINYGW